MRKFIYTFLILIFAVCANAQWQTDVRLTNSTGISTITASSRCVAANGSIVHVVWEDLRDGNTEIYYKRSTNSGVNWGADIRLTNNSSVSNNPCIAVSGNIVHTVWQDSRDGNYEIYYKRSTDGGLNWGADTRLTNNSAISITPSITALGSDLHVAWTDTRNPAYNIYYKRSTDSGVTWGTDTRITDNSSTSLTPSIAVSVNTVCIVWSGNVYGNDEICMNRSTNGGVNWIGESRLTNNTNLSNSPCISFSGSNVNVVWEDNRDGNIEIYYKRSTNNGVNWGADTRLTNNTASSNSPFIEISGSTVHVAWEDSRDGNTHIYYKRSTDGGVNWATDLRLESSTGNCSDPSIFVSNSTVNVVWEDNRNSNDWEIYYKRNPTGNPTGINNISNETPYAFALEQNYPNPFNPVTKIKFDVARIGDVKIAVYDVMGREVQTLVNESLKPGTYEATFDGSQLTSGVYFYKLISGDFVDTKKMLLIK